MDAIELTQKLVRMRTVGPDNDTPACEDLLGEILRAHGFAVERHVMDDGRANLVARHGCDRGAPICFSGHLDTVPLSESSWDRAPFGADISDGLIHGRGTSDMKAGVAAFVVAACAQASRRESSTPILLILSTGEETGCEGVRALVAAHALDPARLLVVAEPTLNRVAAGHKGAQWLKVRVRGRAAHGSMPELGINAAYKAAAILRALEDFRIPATGHPLGEPTVNVGTIHAGTYVNSVPDLAELTLDLRTVPGVDMKERVAAILGTDSEVETMLDLAPVWTDPSDRQFREVGSLANALTGRAVPDDRGVPYFTDASILKPALGNPTTIICGPGDPAQAHRTNEYVSIARIAEAVQLYDAILSRNWDA